MRDYFQILLLGILSGIEPTIYFQMLSVTATFHFFGKYIFPQLRTCSADCTEGSCSSNLTNNF